MYELVQIGENTHYVNSPAKMGVYCLPGGRAILIDSGNDKEAGKKIIKILNDKGWALESVICTHSNADHVGGNKLLADRTGCKIYATKLESAFCEFPILEPSFLYGGFPAKKLRNKFLMAEPSIAHDISCLEMPQGMEAFPLKGHYFDMVGVKTPDDVYFLADCVFSESIIEKYHIFFVYDVAEYLKTLDTIKALRGKRFVPAHAEPTDDIAALANLNREKIFEIIDSIKSICRAPISFDAMLKELFDKYSLTMDFNQYVLVGSTVRSYLSYMLDNQMIGADFQNNTLLWHCPEQ
ncbi:MAG: MBL fold metallo-hydrolase [Clostridiales bacterium]|nr:MBL fold metallo-hydrolase [Clostridiales bacterium]